MSGVVATIYGLLMITGGVMGYRLAGSRASLIGGSVIGGLASIGGVMLFAGIETGRGIAVFASVGAAMYFGWAMSRSMLMSRPVSRVARLLALSVAAAAVLILGR